jgi:ABC-2 type transport system permease protein
MTGDIATMMWKELKELVFVRANLRGGWVGLVIVIAVFGIFLPLQSGPEWLESALGIVVWAWVPFLMVSSVVADSFAGERERHTLETLLASRLSDRAILFGKLGAAVGYGWGLTLASSLLALITINVAFGRGRLLLYPVDIALGIVGLSFLIALLAAGLGVLISLRAATVRQAQQTFSIINLVLFIPLFVFPALPDEVKARIMQVLSQVNADMLAILVPAGLALVDIALVAAALVRFQRARLILD